VVAVDPADISAEIIIVGAGVAGSALAAVLGQQGRRVILIDPHAVCPPQFRAEKIERDQVALLRKFGLLERLLPNAGLVSQVQGSFDGRIFKTGPIEQYGLHYEEIVNGLRAQIPPAVAFRAGRVESIANSNANSNNVQRVKLIGGEELTARLVVLASGGSSAVEAQLGLRRRVLRKDQSLGLGFDFAAANSQPFPFDGLTYYSMSPSTCIDYLTLFKFRKAVRANLFVFRTASDPWVREFIQQPEAMLRRYLPKLTRITGEYRVISKVESGRVDLYTVDHHPQPGVVLIGDAFQSACPATGLGMDKVLTDVDALSECLPRWLATPGMSAAKMAEFYQHPRKLAVDSLALQRSQDHRRLAMDPSPRWRIHRFLLHLKWKLLGSSARLVKTS
jgi:2-polyprenyl-6-methoxyphenol hydroxylase-like FAD-dependent oxidoreductase